MGLPDVDEREGPQGGGARARRRWRSRIALGVAAVALAGAGAAWLGRERIAEDVIDDYLAARGVPATYRIVGLGPRVQVIEDLVVGDPARPDLTVRRMAIELGVGWAGPEVRRVRIEGARLFARQEAGGGLTFGALDPLVFTGSGEPPRLPAIDLTLRDARALLASDLGRVGMKLEGTGRLDDGFAGTLAASAPGIGTAQCRAAGATLYGRITTEGGSAALEGPLRLRGLDCAGARLARGDIGAVVSLAPDFAAAEADFRIAGTGAAFADMAARALEGTAALGWSQGRLALAHDLALTGIAAPQGRLARLAAEGNWRGAADGSSGQWEGTLRGAGLAPAQDFAAGLAAAARAGEGTLLGPLVARAGAGLQRSLAGASLRAEAVIRHKGAEARLTIPEASLASARGTRVLAFSRVSAGLGAAGLTDLAGNLLAGGEGLPQVNARIAQATDGGAGWTMRLAMAEYAAGPDRIAIPRLAVSAAPDGALRFDGLVQASGTLPGGSVEDLSLPLEGRFSPAAGLALGTRCAPLRFTALALSGLELEGQQVTLCPEGRAPILAYGKALRLAARTGPLRLEGRMGESPARLAAAGAVLRYPEPFVLEDLALDIGDGSGSPAVRLAAASLTGRLGEAIGGDFAGGTARLAAVPLDLDVVSGRWSFGEGALRVEEGAFTLSDRPAEGEPRFAPLEARGATLTLADSRITAEALLRHPGSQAEVAAVTIAHDLGTATGGARLAVPGLVFGEALQPADLTILAGGKVSLARGRVTGAGRIDWTADAVTSSGRFATEGLDFAAAFGPVRGLSGEVAFTDLLNLTTAPDQRLAIAAINPGVEVLAGTVQFELRDGTLLALEDARFPFMGGTLEMRPLTMDFSRPEERRYVFEITGLDAATFVAEMELSNLSATGTFDGTVPVIFDKDGNGRIEGGLLIARPGGGNVAYIGELSYEDLGTMGNYAFSALRSLDYRQMSVGLGGDLTGEIITSFNFDGVRQGAGASRNFITRRLAGLPIRFRVNVRSENFYELATMVRSFWDAGYLADPRSRFRTENGRLVPVLDPVQPPESEGQP